MTNVLCDYTGYEERKYAEPGMHKDLVVERLRTASGAPHVVKQHTVALPKNVALMRECSLRPVVLVRNIFDTMESVLSMKMTRLGPCDLRETVVGTTEGMLACQDYGREFGKGLA